MFVKNTWYVCAQPEEINRTPMSRTICNENIVFWRKEDGTPLAFEDRCCHRRMPLSKGKLVGDKLECYYHGLQFDEAGKCTHVPGQTTIPPGAEVGTYPIVEKYNWMWIWRGDPALADEDKIVPPNQAEIMVEVLRRKGLPVAYVLFAGEQHGFRKAENIKRALDGEFYFFSRVFGFEPADAIEPLEIENLSSG